MKTKNKNPVKVNDILELKCEEIGEKNDGIFKKDGYVIFVPKTEKGRTYEIQITKVFTTFGFGKIIQEVK